MGATMMTDTLSPAELLKEAVEHPIMSHPFLDRFAAGGLDDQGLRRFAIQWYKTARAHKRAFPYVVAVTRDDDIRFGLIHILNEEYGEGNPDRIHARLLERLLQRLGISLEEVDATPTIEEVDTFSQGVLRIWSDQSQPVVAYGLHFCLEVVASFLHKALAKGLQTNYDLDQWTLEYFVLHSTVEEHHASQAEEGLKRYAEKDPRHLKDLQTGINRGLELMGGLYNGFERHIFAA